MKRCMKKILVIVGILLAICMSLIIYFKVQISSIDRYAENASINKIKFIEWLQNDTSDELVINYYPDDSKSSEVYDEELGVYNYVPCYSDNVLSMEYGEGEFFDISSKRIAYFFEEESQKCNGVVYYIDKKNRALFLEVVEKEFGKAAIKEDKLVEKKDFVFSWTSMGDEIKARIVFE